MAHSNDDNEDEQTLRSIRDDSFALVTFESKTLRNIDVFWMDYNGDRVKYTTIGPNVTFFIQTYETHPWIFRDEESGAVLLADGRDVFFPQPYDGREQPHVNIHIPVYSLRTLCMMNIRHHTTADVIKEMDIPRHLIPEILYKENTPCKFHIPLEF